ncbi:metallophosphoesterase family protein [Massilia sp. TSP1-1-2]|uniref:metallophosphoesterase family protein n=1 Tax=unclassified Massilia TaxID=2609279 RepID=UPI003CE6CE47
MVRIGVISDTHGLLRPEAMAALAGSDYIVHGGDIGNAAILAELAAIAPLTVVRGNNDTGAWARAVPASARLQVGSVLLYAVHDIATLDIDPVREGVQVVIYGHSHRPLAQQRGPVLYLNPGSAGPRRFKLPVSVALIDVNDGTMHARIVELNLA